MTSEEQQSGLRPHSATQRKMLELAVQRYSSHLEWDLEGLQYLEARGIDESAAGSARLGLVSDDPLPGHERLKGWLCIPYLDGEGNPLQVRFRCIQDHNHREHGHGKYYSLPGEPSRMYSVGSILRAGTEIHLCEGEINALVLNMIGLHAASVAGAQSWKPHHRRMLAGFSRVWVWGDPDEAGAEFVGKVTRSMWQAVPLQLAQDVNDTYLNGGREELMRVLSEGREAIE